MGANPRCELVFGEGSVGSTEDSGYGFGLWGFKLEIVDREKGIGGDERGSLVPVDKGVVLGDAESVGGGKRRKVCGRFVVPLLLRPC